LIVEIASAPSTAKIANAAASDPIDNATKTALASIRAASENSAAFHKSYRLVLPVPSIPLYINCCVSAT